MPYFEEIAQALIDTLTKTAGLPTFQLAGHVPNLSFWMQEVTHARNVVAGYSTRFNKLVEAQGAYDIAYPEQAKSREHQEYDYHPPRLALSPTQAERLMTKLMSTANSVIDRCLREKLINLSTADSLRDVLSQNS